MENIIIYKAVVLYSYFIYIFIIHTFYNKFLSTLYILYWIPFIWLKIMQILASYVTFRLICIQTYPKILNESTQGKDNNHIIVF